MLCIFFFKQKTAYEMRISDWSSDVCSSDLRGEIKPFSSNAAHWFGVLVENGQVVLMNLSANQCQGKMTTDWSVFVNLMSLDLSSNLISGRESDRKSVV